MSVCWVRIAKVGLAEVFHPHPCMRRDGPQPGSGFESSSGGAGCAQGFARNHTPWDWACKNRISMIDRDNRSRVSLTWAQIRSFCINFPRSYALCMSKNYESS